MRRRGAVPEWAARWLAAKRDRMKPGLVRVLGMKAGQAPMSSSCPSPFYVCEGGPLGLVNDVLRFPIIIRHSYGC